MALPARGLIVDMVGRKGLTIRREGFSQERARVVLDEVFAIARKKGARHFVDAPGKHILDDHIAFLQRGIPVANLIDIDDPNWHTQDDRLENLDPHAMAEVAEVVLEWIPESAPAGRVIDVPVVLFPEMDANLREKLDSLPTAPGVT